MDELAAMSGGCCIVLIILAIILFVAIIIWLTKDRSTKVYTVASPSSNAQQSIPPPPLRKSKGKPCPDCSGSMEYISDYGRWYCDRCEEYK